MKISFIILFSIFLSSGLLCQKQIESLSQFKKNTSNDTTVKIDGKEKMPEIIGGINSIQSKIIYPKEAKENNIEGKVYIRCKITSEGEVEEIEVVKGLGFGCDEEAIRVVKDSKWKPGEVNNVPTDMYISIPIIFEFKKT